MGLGGGLPNFLETLFSKDVSFDTFELTMVLSFVKWLGISNVGGLLFNVKGENG